MIHVVVGVLLAAALLVAPGLLLARLGGVRGWGAASAALPLSCAVIGTSEIVAAVAGWAWVPWGWAAIAGVTAVAAGLLVAVRRLVPGGRTQSADPPRDGGGRSDLRVPAGLAVACLVLGIGTLAGMGSMSTPAQAFDIVFHSNAVQAIRQLGNASSFGSMSALYQGVPTYYPTVWHGAVALLPASVTVSSNAMVLVVAALAWPLGIAGLLAEVLVHDPMYTDDELAAFGWTPYHLGERVDAAIVQADHPEYHELAPVDLPGIRLLLDGRRITDAGNWTGVPRLTIGGGE